MSIQRKTFVSSAAALLVFASGMAFESAWAQTEGMQGTVIAAQRYRAAQEGATAIKLQAAPVAAATAQRATESHGAMSNVAAERNAICCSNVAAERRVPDGGNVAAERRVPDGGNIAAERRVPDGGNVAAERRVPGDN